MKNFLALLSITVFFLGNVYAQQNNIYILVDAKYTKKLTYETSLVGALNMQSNSTKEKTFECYSFPGEENITAYFKISKKKKGGQFTKLPANTIKPKSKALNRTLLNNVMNINQVAYLLKRTSKGYDSYSIEGTSYIQETPEDIAYSNSEGVYEIKKATMQVSYTSAFVNGLNNELKVSHRIEGNRIIGYKVEISDKQSLEFIPGLGLRSDIQKLNKVQLKYVNQFTAKDYLNKLKGDPISIVASGTERNNTPIEGIDEPIAGSSRPGRVLKAPSTVDFFAEPQRAVAVKQTVNKTGMQPIPSQNTLEGTPFSKGGQPAKVVNQLPIKKDHYRVVDGDNLYSISRKFNIPVKRLMVLNKLESYTINVNQQLRVVDDGSVVSSMNPTLREYQEVNSRIKSYVYKIEQNDTLFSIATKFKTTIANLCILNKIEDINHALNIDDELIIRQSIVSE